MCNKNFVTLLAILAIALTLGNARAVYTLMLLGSFFFVFAADTWLWKPAEGRRDAMNEASLWPQVKEPAPDAPMPKAA
jgi:hypothetical protein